MSPDEIEGALVRLADELARIRRRLVTLVDELTGVRRRIGELERGGRLGPDEGGTVIALPPPPPPATRTDPYDIRDMDDEPTRREKRP